MQTFFNERFILLILLGKIFNEVYLYYILKYYNIDIIIDNFIEVNNIHGLKI
jgi:hypothetical protein